MNWIQLDLSIINGTFTPATLAEYNGMPLSNPPAPALTPANAPAGTLFIEGNMPVSELPPIAAPAPSPPGFGGMPLSGPVLPPLTPANAPAGVTFLDGNMPLGNELLPNGSIAYGGR